MAITEKLSGMAMDTAEIATHMVHSPAIRGGDDLRLELEAECHPASDKRHPRAVVPRASEKLWA
jgi:hypothetical protein